MAQHEDESGGIFECARRFRRLIETCDRGALCLPIQAFPNGSCGDVCPLLAAYLSEQGYPAFHYVCGERERIDDTGLRFGSHAWLQKGSLIVDITADQFPEISLPVIVTASSEWHRSLSGEDKGVADFRERFANEPSILAAFREAYACINRHGDLTNG